MKRPRVLLVGNFLSTAGLNRGVCEDLAERLRAAGWHVITTSDKPARLPRLLDMVRTAWTRRHDYDVAHVDVYSGPAFLWAEVVCAVLRRAGKSYILTLHGGNLPAFAQRWPGRVRRLLASAVAVTTPSRYLLDKMAPYRADLLLIPNPLDISRYPFRLRTHARPQLIWLRAFHRIYHPILTVHVVNRLRGEWPDVHLLMIGPDKGDGTLAEFRHFVADHCLETHITCIGGVPKAEVPTWLQKGDIFLNTTTIESFGVSVMEAAATGLCIVTTDVGELPYLWRDGQDALLVPPDDPDAMAAAVRRILTEPGLAERLSRNARQKAEGYDWSVVLPQWEWLLSSLGVRR